MSKKVDYRYKELAEHFGLGVKKKRGFRAEAGHKVFLSGLKAKNDIALFEEQLETETDPARKAFLMTIVLEHKKSHTISEVKHVAELTSDLRNAVLKALIPNHLKSEALQQLVSTAPNENDRQMLVNTLTAETEKAKKMNKLTNQDIMVRLDALTALSMDGHLDKTSPSVSSLHADYVKEVINRHGDKEKNPLSIGILVGSMHYLQPTDRANVVDLMARELRTGDLAELQINTALTVEERTKIIAGVVERSNLKKISNDTIMYAVQEGLLDGKTSELIFTKKGREFAKDAGHIGGMLEAVSNTESRINVCGKSAIGTMLKQVGNSDFHKAIVSISNSDKLVAGNLKDTFSVIPTDRLTKAFGYRAFLNDVNMEQMRDGIIAAGNKEMAAALFKKLDDKGMYDKLEILVKEPFFQDIAKEQINSGKMSVAAFEHLVFRGGIEVETADLPTKKGGGLTRVGDKYNNRLFVNEHINTDQVSRSEKFRYDTIVQEGRAPGVIERIKNRLSGKSTQMFPSDRGEEYDYHFMETPKSEATTPTKSAPGMLDNSGVTGDTASDRTADAVKVASELAAKKGAPPAIPARPANFKSTNPVSTPVVPSTDNRPPLSGAPIPPPPPMPGSSVPPPEAPSAPKAPPAPEAPPAPKAPAEADQAQVEKRSGLLAQIQKGAALKKATTNDRSAPQTEDKPKAEGNNQQGKPKEDFNADLAKKLAGRRRVNAQVEDVKDLYKNKDDKYLDNAKKLLEEQLKEGGKSEEDKSVINEKLSAIEAQMKKNQKAVEAEKEAAEASRIRDEKFASSPYKETPIADVLQKEADIKKQIAAIDKAVGQKYGNNILSADQKKTKLEEKAELSKVLKDVEFALEYRMDEVDAHKEANRPKVLNKGPGIGVGDLFGSRIFIKVAGAPKQDANSTEKTSWEERVLKGAAGKKEELEALKDKYSAKDKILREKEDGGEFLSDKEEEKQQKWAKKMDLIKKELDKGPGSGGRQ